MATFYCDLSLGTNGHSGTALDPFSFTDMQGQTAANQYDTIYTKGSLSTNVTTFYIDVVQLKPWDAATNGPWRIHFTGPVDTFVAIDGACSGGVLRFSDAGSFVDGGGIGFGSVDNCVLIFDVPVAVYELALNYCTIFGNIVAIADISLNLNDCIVAGDFDAGGNNPIILCTNCALHGATYSSATRVDCQQNWTAPSAPVWDGPLAVFDYSVFSSGIATPPQPGQPPYTNFPTFLWGETRMGIGTGSIVSLPPEPPDEGSYGSNFAYGMSPLYKDDGEEVAEVNPCNDGSAVPLTRCLDIIKRAMRILHVIEAGETPKAQEATDFMQVLNWMLDEWSNQRLLTYYIVNEIFPTVGGQGTYTIGPDDSCDFNTMNPIKITSAFLRDTSPGYNNDWKLELIPNDRYQDIFQKSILSSYPRFLHFEHSWPYGTLNLWPTPTKAYSLNISQWKQFTKFTSIQDIVCLPPGYKDAMALNLAVKMAPEFNGVSPDVVKMAIEALAPLKENNYQIVYLDTDQALTRRNIYNIYSDRYW